MSTKQIYKIQLCYRSGCSDARDGSSLRRTLPRSNPSSDPQSEIRKLCTLLHSGTIRPCRGFQDSRACRSPERESSTVRHPVRRFNQPRCRRSSCCSDRRSGPQNQRRDNGRAWWTCLSQAGDESPAEIKGHRCPEGLAQWRRDQQGQQAVHGRRVAVATVGQAGTDHR